MKPLCRNQLGNEYTSKDAIQDLMAALEKGQRPIDPRNLETRTTRYLHKW